MAKKKKEVPMMLTQSKVKEFAKETADVNVGGEFLGVLNEQVADLVEKAVNRCLGNGRKTLKGQDV
jgi:histone H3/H4